MLYYFPSLIQDPKGTFFMPKAKKTKKTVGYRSKTKITLYRELDRQLVDFFMRSGNTQTRRAIQARFLDVYDPTGATTSVSAELYPFFVEWALYDNGELVGGPSLIKDFAMSRSDLDEETVARIHRLLSEYRFGFFVVTAIEGDGTVVVQELGAEQPGGYQVHLLGARIPEEGEILLTRLIPWNDKWLSVSGYVELGNRSNHRLAGDLRELRQKYEPHEWRLFMAFFQPKLLFNLFRNRNIDAHIHTLAQAPKFTRNHVELEQVRSLADKKDFPRAIALAEKELKRNPQNRQMRLLLIAACLADGRPSDSIARFKEWVQQEQDQVKLRLGFAEELASRDLFQEAFDILEPALEVSEPPAAFEIRCACGTYLYRMGEIDRGRDMMLDAVRDSDYDPALVRYSAGVLFHGSEYATARDLLLQQELLGKTLDSGARALLGFCHYYESEWEKALEAFDRAPEFEGSPLSLLPVADCAFNLKRYNRARNNYQEYLRRQEKAKSDKDGEEEQKNPEVGTVHYRLAFLEWKRGMRERAWPHLQQAIRNDFYHPDVFWLMSMLCLERGETDRAKVALRLLSETDPDHPGILPLYYRLYPGTPLRRRPMRSYGARRSFRRFRNRNYRKTTL